MSMLSAQVDELRELALWLDDEFYDEYATRARDAADTILALRDKAQELQAENAKLRELVRDVMRFFEDGDYCTVCEVERECTANEQYNDDCLMRDIFHDRMRELGVEVE